MQRIRRKLEPDRQHPRYVLTEPGVGYWVPAPDAPPTSPAGDASPQQLALATSA